MPARRRARLGVTSMLRRTPRIGRGRRHQALALVRRQRLILGPFFAQVLLLVLARHLGEALVILARLAPLVGGELGPRLHAARDALLLLALHARIALGNRDPFLTTLGFERVPVGLERGEDLLLLGGELGPGRAYIRFGGRCLGRRFGGRFLGASGRRLRRRPGGDGEGQEDDQGAQHHSSAARFLSQFWKPRSR